MYVGILWLRVNLCFYKMGFGVILIIFSIFDMFDNEFLFSVCILCEIIVN